MHHRLVCEPFFANHLLCLTRDACAREQSGSDERGQSVALWKRTCPSQSLHDFPAHGLNQQDPSPNGTDRGIIWNRRTYATATIPPGILSHRAGRGSPLKPRPFVTNQRPIVIIGGARIPSGEGSCDSAPIGDPGIMAGKTIQIAPEHSAREEC